MHGFCPVRSSHPLVDQALRRDPPQFASADVQRRVGVCDRRDDGTPTRPRPGADGSDATSSKVLPEQVGPQAGALCVQGALVRVHRQQARGSVQWTGPHPVFLAELFRVAPVRSSPPVALSHVGFVRAYGRASPRQGLHDRRVLRQ